jgi:diamine N-acetyltransferase
VTAGPRLEPVTQENVRAACDLKLRPGQEGLVAPVARSLAYAYTLPDVAWPRLIYDGDRLVEFVMAAFDPASESTLYRAYLWMLSIGAEHQGGGYGRFAVDEVCKEALRRGQHRVTVSYTPGEDGPAGFYRRLGFHPTGEFNQGEEVAELILASPPATAARSS